MSLHSTELSKLARALAKAFPDYQERMRLAAKAEVVAKAQVTGDALEAWRDIVHCAQQAGHLQVLIDAALLEQPQNPELKRFQLEDEGKRREISAGHLWVAGAILAAAGLAFFLGSDSDGDTSLADASVASTAEAEVAPVPKSDAPAGSIGLAEKTSESEKTVLASDVPTNIKEPVVERPVVVPANGEMVSGRCGGERGTLVGYFYGGDGLEAAVGEPYEMLGDVNVRKDYPHKGNGWSFREPIVCVLKKGDTVVLTKAPFGVDGDKVWSPLYAGDLRPM